MKLSDIKGERTLEVIADLIDPIANIAEDAEAAELFARKKLPEGVSPKTFLLNRARKSLPVLLRNHKKDLVAIMSAIDGVSPQEYESRLNLVTLVQDLTELMTDEAFGVLFISAQSGNNSGSAQVSTEAQKQ